MDKISVSNGDRRIEVNDSGEYIVLPLGDCSFPVRYFAMCDRVTAHIESLQPEAEAMDGRLSEMTLAEQMRAKYALDLKLHEKIKEEFDGLFGAGTCRKVFGDIVPSIELYDAFLSQLTPIFAQYAKERAEKLSRYSEARAGDV